ncbi:MAG: 2-C-methyl-D-erythritol 2,4-cyclodiphosphate synthase [Desulfomonilaceae bacterium]
MRIGYGFDVHGLIKGRKLFLGGVEIDYPYGLEGHSDADVIVHAVIDALLGAAGLGDIGMRFPDTDPKYKGVSSLKLLIDVMTEIHSLGFRISNADVTLLAQKPKIGPYREQMVKTLAWGMEIDKNRVNIKATTTEHLGFVGRCEGIAAAAVVLLEETPAVR